MKKNYWFYSVAFLALAAVAYHGGIFKHFSRGPASEQGYQGSRIQDVWNMVEEKPYREGDFPTEKVDMSRMKRWGENRLTERARATVDDRSDVLPYFEKLVHPNGVCMLGEWEIDTNNPYSGLFKRGSRALIISRASVALSEVNSGEYRAFGLTGKLFNTTDMNHSAPIRTANFFTIEDLGGTTSPRFATIELTNEPPTTIRASMVFIARMALYVAKIIGRTDPPASIRQLWQISEIGETPATQSTPMWIRLKGVTTGSLSSARDFRDELISNVRRLKEVKFDIEVAGKIDGDSSQKQNFVRIGTIRYYDIVASEGCDHQLHFNHPKFRTDVK